MQNQMAATYLELARPRINSSPDPREFLNEIEAAIANASEYVRPTPELLQALHNLRAAARRYAGLDDVDYGGDRNTLRAEGDRLEEAFDAAIAVIRSCPSVP